MTRVVQLFVVTVFLALCLQDSSVDAFFHWIFRRGRGRRHRRPSPPPPPPRRRYAPPPLSDGSNYRGCFPMGSATLPGIHTRIGHNKPTACKTYCKNKHYQYAALRSSTCYCGEHVKKTGVSRSLCGYRCPGFNHRRCGGSAYMSLYDTGVQGYCECSASGDPHFYTYNRNAIHFQGICTYTLSKSTIPNDKCAFNFEVKNEHRGRNTRVSYVRSVFIKAHGDEIQFRRNEIYVNNVRRYLPYEKKNQYEIYKTGNNVRFQSSCFYHVEWDTRHAVTVNVPIRYKDKMTGICGKCNIAKKNDDYMTKGNRNVLSLKPSIRDALIGDSYAVHDPDKRCKTINPPNKCTPALNTVASSVKSCGYLNPANKANNPFKTCLDRFTRLAKERFNSCIFDYCSTDQTHLRQKIVCEALADFAELCVRRGQTISRWRKPNFCPYKCKKHEVYKTSTTGCPTSCLKPNRVTKCHSPNSEGCACKPGYTLSGMRCVQKSECGCKDKDGNYLPIGSSVITCNEIKTCIKTAGTTKLRITPRAHSCPKFSTCTGYILKDKCQCIKGYEMKGNLCLPKRPQLCRCVASGDPHYITYDRQVIHFQGICKYTLTKSLKANDPCGFNVEVKNEHRGRNRKVSFTKNVYVTVKGDTISFIGNKIYINGLRIYLPLFGKSYKLIRRPNRAVHLEVPQCNIYVVWNSRAASVTVSVPKTYTNQMSGICGNCNGKKDDFKTKDGKDVSGKANKYALIGDSYLVKDANGIGKCASIQPPNKCSANQKLEARKSTNCGYLSPSAGKKNPFAQCIQNNKDVAKLMYDSCVFDFCAYAKDKTRVNNVKCNALTAFAEVCEERGYLVNWRKSNFCPLKCGPNMVYSNSVSACPGSCLDPFTWKTCKYPDTIGCKCRSGYRYSGDKCIKKCGCKAKNGRYYPDKTMLWSKDCKTKSICTNGLFVSPRKTYTCPMNSKCALSGGRYHCKCNKGYIKNGNQCKAKRTECSTKADIVFLLDASGSVKKHNFQKMLKFVQDFTHKFNIGRNDMQIGISTFATSTKLAFNLKKYHNKADLISAIGKVHYSRGWTRTEKALTYLRTRSFTNAAGHRSDVPKIAIVLTDGKSNKPKLTKLEANKVHAAGIRVFAVGIGKGADNKELNAIASDPDRQRMLHVDNFNALNSIVNELSTKTCEDANKDEVTVCEGKKTSISCTKDEFIDIKSATYGRTNRKSCPASAARTKNTNCRASNTHVIVKRKCQGEKMCTLEAANPVFGNPCSGIHKYLHVRYTCKPDKNKRVTVCEGGQKSIRCPGTNVIHIIKAAYGRSNTWTCPRSSHLMKNTNCFARGSSSVVGKLCNGKRGCKLSAKNAVFTDPCKGTVKYLTVQYECRRLIIIPTIPPPPPPKPAPTPTPTPKPTPKSVCMLPHSQKGPCRLKTPRWSYNSRTGKCVPFTYGGCGGNMNRYTTEIDCVNNCKHRDCYKKHKGEDYKGRISYTISGYKCQRWTSNSPHKHSFCFSNLPENYCRNPDGGSRPWCYTTNPKKRWEYCNVLKCGSVRRMDSVCDAKHSYNPRFCLSATRWGLGGTFMWSYNSKTGQCVNFKARCGGGNKNKFKKQSECSRTCQAKDCYSDAQGKDYDGFQSYTRSGYKCQYWTLNYPHKHSPSLNHLPENYCRNPDNSKRPWCYTTNPKKRWDYCNVKSCGTHGAGKCKITKTVNKKLGRVKYVIVGNCEFVSVKANKCTYTVNLYQSGWRSTVIVKLPNQRPYVLKSGVGTRKRNHGCVSIRLNKRALVLDQAMP